MRNKKSVSIILLISLLLIFTMTNSAFAVTSSIELLPKPQYPELHDLEVQYISNNGRYIVYKMTYGSNEDVYGDPYYGVLIYDCENNQSIGFPEVDLMKFNSTNNRVVLYSNMREILIYNLETGVLNTVSAPENFISTNFSFSQGEHYIVYNGMNDDGSQQVFRQDITDGSIELISVNDQGIAANALSGVAWRDTVSEDNRYVVFTSKADNLDPSHPADQKTTTNIFIRDTVLGTTRMIDKNLNGSPSLLSHVSSMTDNGLFIKVSSNEPLLPNTPMYSYHYLYDQTTGLFELVNFYDLIGQDGKYIYQSRNGKAYVYERKTTASTCISVSNSGLIGNNESAPKAVSTNGKYVVLVSNATNLVAGAPTGNNFYLVTVDYPDPTAPVTKCKINGTVGETAPYESDIEYTLTANDGTGSGVAKIEYSFDHATWLTYDGPVQVTKDMDANFLWFRATDHAGNQEIARKITISVE